MKSKVAGRILANTPEDVKIFVSLYAALVVRVNQLLKDKGLTQKALAEKLEKKPSEVHKWLSGEHNFTLRSIAKLEAELGETLLEVPVRKTVNVFHSFYGKITFKVYKNVAPKKEEKVEEWKNAISTQTQLANVG